VDGEHEAAVERVDMAHMDGVKGTCVFGNIPSLKIGIGRADMHAIEFHQLFTTFSKTSFTTGKSRSGSHFQLEMANRAAAFPCHFVPET